MADRLRDEYLWTRSGEPDEELRTLESLLERYRFDQPFSPLDRELDGFGAIEGGGSREGGIDDD